ncbi:MAG: EAL domain-containing protein [Bryobacteraceae bacterium]|jgi:EAL and modified HD-GYP domain-containing signal transduction protein
MDVFVARQPILDRQRHLYAYELLFRSDARQDAYEGDDGAAASTGVIANALLAIGLENLLCGKKAFINFDRSLLLGGLHSVLPPEILVIEVLETVEPDSEVLAACRQLCAQGYAFAMDDFVAGLGREPLARLAKFIKVDLLATSRPDQERLLRTYQPLGIAMLAEKVETREEFEWALGAGYDYFQGYFFARPATLRGQRIPAAEFTCLRLLAEVQQDEPDVARLHALISGDVSLSYSLLLYVNSALFTRAAEIRSIDEAMASLGEEGIRHWVVLAALPVMAEDKPGELVTLSLVRARFCEHIASLARIAPPHLGFLMGLFSLLDALTDLPIHEALANVHAAPAITGVLTGSAPPGDPYRDVYQMALRYEAGDWDAVTALAAAADIQTSQIAEAYGESTFWAQRALHATLRKTDSRRHVRQPATGELQLQWEDPGGRESVVKARLMNASAEGLQLLVSDRIPVPSAVGCNEPKLGISGRGRVRYCNYVEGKYLIGVEFHGSSGSHEFLESRL